MKKFYGIICFGKMRHFAAEGESFLEVKAKTESRLYTCMTSWLERGQGKRRAGIKPTMMIVTET